VEITIESEDMIEEVCRFSQGQTMTHGKAVGSYEGVELRLEKVSLHLVAAQRVGSIQDQDFLA
jgi:hypothetical protein